MKNYRVYITCVEVYEVEAEDTREAEFLAHSGNAGDALERYDTKDIYTEEMSLFAL